MGEGVFTNVQIPASVPIMEIAGTVYTNKTLPHPNDPNVLQIGPNTYLAPSGGVDDYLNHSCNPNCLIHVVGNRAILYSMYVIPIHNELTFDYSTSSTDTLETWQMKCQCGSNNCRQIISGFKTLNNELQNKYIKNGMVAIFITKPNFQEQ